MKLILNILLMVGISVLSFAQTPKTELETLTDNYNKAKERAIKPIDDKYKEELKKLLEKYSKQGNVAEVEKITPLLKAFNKGIDFTIIDTEWISESGTTFRFQDRGRGRRQFGDDSTDLSWKYLDIDTIEVITRKSKTGPVVIIYMRLSAVNGVYGDSLDKMTSNIVQVK